MNASCAPGSISDMLVSDSVTAWHMYKSLTGDTMRFVWVLTDVDGVMVVVVVGAVVVSVGVFGVAVSDIEA